MQKIAFTIYSKSNNDLMSLRFIMVILLISLTSCNNKQQKIESSNYENLCQSLKKDSIQILNGTLSVSSKNNLIFDNRNNQKEWHQKTHLVPCSEDLIEYVINAYDAHLYLRNAGEEFWISVQGKYIADTVKTAPAEFLFNSVSLIDELEAKKDSSQVLRNDKE